MEISLQTVTRDEMIADKSLRGTGFGMPDIFLYFNIIHIIDGKIIPIF